MDTETIRTSTRARAIPDGTVPDRRKINYVRLFRGLLRLLLIGIVAVVALPVALIGTAVLHLVSAIRNRSWLHRQAAGSPSPGR